MRPASPPECGRWSWKRLRWVRREVAWRVSGFAGARTGDIQRGLHFAGEMIALVVRGEVVLGYVVAVLLDRGGEEGGAVGVLTRELSRRREGEIEEIVEGEDLAVAVGT